MPCLVRWSGFQVGGGAEEAKREIASMIGLGSDVIVAALLFPSFWILSLEAFMLYPRRTTLNKNATLSVYELTVCTERSHTTLGRSPRAGSHASTRLPGPITTAEEIAFAGSDARLSGH